MVLQGDRNVHKPATTDWVLSLEGFLQTDVAFYLVADWPCRPKTCDDGA